MTQTCLVTGGGGNIACRLSFLLAERFERVLLFDTGARPSFPVANNCEYIQGDITQAESWLPLFEQRIDVVLHFASLLSGSSEVDRPLAWKINVDAALALLEASIKHQVRQFLFPSSVAAFGSPLPPLVKDDQPQWPTSLYGVSKVAVERLGVYYHAKHGLDFRGLRLPVVISPHAALGAASAYASRAIIEAVANGRFTFRVRPETRPSLIYVKDVVQGIVRLLDAEPAKLSQRVYNMQALAPTAQELADAIQRRLPAAELRFDPDPQIANLIESWPIEFDDSAARRDWGWESQFGLEALVDDMLRELAG